MRQIFATRLGLSGASTRRRGLTLVMLLACSIAAGATARPAGALTLAPSLQGELFTTNTGQSQGSCDANGNSTITFSASGVATGPYPGTFAESGIATIGPQTGPLTAVGLADPAPSGTVILFHASFTIDSAAGQVSGTKDLSIHIVQNTKGFCFSRSSTEFCPPQLTSGTLQYEAVSNTASDYEASITTTTGSFTDSGLATSDLSAIHTICNLPDGTPGGGGSTVLFSESFYLSNGVVPLTTPGHAEGGGQIDHLTSSGISLGLTAYSKDGGTILAHCNVVDGAVHIRCLDATQYSQTGNNATFSGTADISGTTTTYRIDVQDNAESGIGQDTFSITTGTGYSASGVLTQGNVQVHG